MSYKTKPQITTTIVTRINETHRISSVYRRFANEHFEQSAWETILWNQDKYVEEFETFYSADSVVNLHQEIIQRFKDGEFQ